MARKNKTISDTWRWGLYLVIGVLFMAGVVFFSSWQALRATEARFCQILDFVKSQSTSFEKHNDTIVAKALRRAAVSVHQLAQDPALDLSDPECLNRQAELLWLTGISVLAPDGTLLCESTTNGIGYARFGEQLKNDAVLDVFAYPQKTYLKRVLLEMGLRGCCGTPGRKQRGHPACLPLYPGRIYRGNGLVHPERTGRLLG